MRIVHIAHACLLIATTTNAHAQMPPVDEVCAQVMCREETQLQLAMDEQQYFQSTFNRSPLTYRDVVIIIDGETLYIEAEVSDDNLISLKAVPENTNPDRTITLNFQQPGKSERDPTTMLTIENPFDKPFRYHLSMDYVGGNGLVYTSSCAVKPRLPAIELWSFPIKALLLTRFRFVDPEDEGAMGCH